MSDEKKETIEDIVAEMRAMPECIIMDASAKFVLSKYADRIEAAGNASAKPERVPRRYAARLAKPSDAGTAAIRRICARR